MRDAVALWTAMLALAALAWAWSVDMSMGMAPMSQQMSPGFPALLAMWAVMMPAMMLPSVIPVATAYLRVVRKFTGSVVRIPRMTAFVVGYLVAWGTFSVLAAGAQVGLRSLGDTFPTVLRWGAPAGLVAVGLFQFSRVKEACLNQCRTPMAFLLQVGNYRGVTRDLRAGLYHGGYCVGCCAALMGLFVLLGSMSLLLMGVLTAIVVLEKAWLHGKTFAHVVGVVCIALAPVLLRT